MPSLRQLVVFLLSLVTFVYTFYVVGRLMCFLSVPKVIPKTYIWVFNLLDNRSRLETAYGPIIYDTLYLVLFILQHSVMKSEVVKGCWQRLGLATAERSIYCLTSSYCLQFLLTRWQTANSIVLWQVNVESSNVLWWTFVLVHAFAWVVIYGGSLIMDLPEILGLKQAYYDLKNFSPPISYKSLPLRNLYAHVRHPSFVGLSVILWATNLMTLDRLVLSSMLTTYMYLAWSTDHEDVMYQKYQLKRKMRELQRI